MTSERPNAHMIFLPTELYMGLIKKMAASEIGRSAAILDCVNESLHNQGFVSRKIYLKFRDRYRKKLVDIVKEREEVPTIRCQEVEKLKLQRTLVMVIEQWDIHDQQWRQKWVSRAEELKDTIPEAKEILRKAGILD